MKLTIKTLEGQTLASFQIKDCTHEDLFKNLQARRCDKVNMFVGLKDGGTLILGNEIIEKSIIEIS